MLLYISIRGVLPLMPRRLPLALFVCVCIGCAVGWPVNISSCFTDAIDQISISHSNNTEIKDKLIHFLHTLPTRWMTLEEPVTLVQTSIAQQLIKVLSWNLLVTVDGCY